MECSDIDGRPVKEARGIIDGLRTRPGLHASHFRAESKRFGANSKQKQKLPGEQCSTNKVQVKAVGKAAPMTFESRPRSSLIVNSNTNLGFLSMSSLEYLQEQRRLVRSRSSRKQRIDERTC